MMKTRPPSRPTVIGSLLGVIVAFALLVPTAEVAAEDEVGRIWGGLILATEGADDRGPGGGQFGALLPDLREVFPGEGFQLLGQHTQNLMREHERWVVPSPEINLRVDYRGPAPGGGLALNLELWHGDKKSLKVDGVLRPDSPIVIRAHPWKGGHVVFVLVLLD